MTSQSSFVSNSCEGAEGVAGWILRWYWLPGSRGSLIARPVRDSSCRISSVTERRVSDSGPASRESSREHSARSGRLSTSSIGGSQPLNRLARLLNQRPSFTPSDEIPRRLSWERYVEPTNQRTDCASQSAAYSPCENLIASSLTIRWPPTARFDPSWPDLTGMVSLKFHILTRQAKPHLSRIITNFGRMIFCITNGAKLPSIRHKEISVRINRIRN